jgi:hypothetical protein
VGERKFISKIIIRIIISNIFDIVTRFFRISNIIIFITNIERIRYYFEA